MFNGLSSWYNETNSCDLLAPYVHGVNHEVFFIAIAALKVVPLSVHADHMQRKITAHLFLSYILHMRYLTCELKVVESIEVHSLISYVFLC